MSDEDAFIEGMAAAHDVVWSTVDRLQQSLNDVLGVYLDVPSRLMHEHPVVSELEVAHQVLNQFRERFVDDYDEVMRKYKSENDL